jgi:outer membrane lipoprotein carrier protein
MLATLLLGLALSHGPIPAAQASAAQAFKAAAAAKASAPAPAAKETAVPAARPAAAPAAKETATPAAKPAATPAPAAPTPPPAAAPLDPEVKHAVDQMQRFYEETRDFEARFEQRYTYKSFGRTTKASGRVRFLKAGRSMRWDYDKPNEKVFVINGNKVYAYDKEAKQLTISGIDTERLSASITFLWGQGKLEREFDIKKASRQDLQGGLALELTPKSPDPRFQKVFFLLDPKSYAVRETIVVDPDGSENRVSFLEVKTNSGFGKEAFGIEPPPDTQILRLDGSGPAGK